MISIFKKKAFWSILFLLVGHALMAQTGTPYKNRNSPSLSEAEIKENAEQLVRRFTAYLTDIADPTKSLDSKMLLIDRACELFENNRSPVQISSSTSKSKVTLQVRLYLLNLARQNRYQSIKITVRKSDIGYVPDLVQKNDSTWIGHVYYMQTFVGEGDRKTGKKYKDKTSKLVTFHLKDLEHKGGNGEIIKPWKMFIIGIEVTQTD